MRSKSGAETKPANVNRKRRGKDMKKRSTAVLAVAVAASVGVVGSVWAGCGACSSCGSAAPVKKMVMADHEHDIVETAVEAGSFKTLVAAVKAADLVSVLKSEGPFTVFAPTDEAFAKLPAGTVESLLKAENRDQLVAILTYHVVPGKVMASDVVKIDEAATVQGQKIGIAVKDGIVSVDGAKVVKTDIETSNGVIHVIDSVIMPKKS